MNGDLAEALVAESEGLKLSAYQDSLGFWTVGYGHRLPSGKSWDGYHITPDEADNLLTQDMANARSLAEGFPYFDELSDTRQAVLISMCFQLGSKPLNWPVFVNALLMRDYTSAAEAGLATLWAKQTPARANREMTMLRTDEWAMSA